MSIISFSSSTLCKRSISVFLLSVLLACTSLMTACGLSDERGDRTGEEANDPRISERDDNTFAVKQIIGIRVESITGQFNRVNKSQISIVTLDENFEEISSRVIPTYRVEDRTNGATGYELQFAKNYIERVNQVVKVTFDQTSTPPVFLYAPLYNLSETEAITVNAVSHYVLKKLFDTISTPEQLAALIPCEENEAECPNQPMAKANLLEQINITARGYTVDIDPESTVEQAMTILDSKLDMRQHIETAVREITRSTSPIAKGTRREFTLNTTDPLTPLNVAQSYNSVFFGLSFSNLTPDDNDRSVNIASSSSVVTEAGRFIETLPSYPSFNQTTTLFDLRRDILSSDIPFQRTTMRIRQNGSIVLNDTETENALISNTTDSFLSTQGNLLNARVLQQTIDDKASIGWDFEPVFSRSYQVNDAELNVENRNDIDYGNAAPWITSANYGKATAFEQTELNPRASRLEDMHLFSWEVHGLETDQDFSLANLSGKEYGAISYSLKFNDQEGTNRLLLIAETAKWQINANTISITQPNPHYQTYSLARADNNTASGLVLEIGLLDTPRSISQQQTEGSSETLNRGRVQLDGQSAPEGHTSQNGSYLAFSFNTKDRQDEFDRGQGIILASELVGFDFTFSGERYQLQGNSFEINDEQNILHQFNGSSLVISAASASDPAEVQCRATLTVQRTSLVHTVDILENTLSEPVESSEPAVNSQSCRLNDSEIMLKFPDVFGKELTLRGFITQSREENSTSPGNLINFIWQQDDQLGLVFASKEQALSPTFE